LFQAIQGLADVTLFPGEGVESNRVTPVGGISRYGLAAKLLGSVSRDIYYWESLSFALVAKKSLAGFDLIHYSEPPLNLAFTRFGPHGPRRLFSHALNMGAEHTLRCHHIHQASPQGYEDARRLGVPVERMTLLPYGVWTDNLLPGGGSDSREQTRREFDLPLDRPILLCVAAINRAHKRIDHLVSEVAMMTERPHVVLCGVLDDPELLAQARRTIGESNVSHLYLSNERIADLYRASDVFALPSIVEGFGLGALEAQLSGLPVIAHDSMHFRWLLGTEGVTLVDMQQRGALAAALDLTFSNLDAAAAAVLKARPAQVERFDWRYLVRSYIDMYATTSSHSSDLIEKVIER
jgi:glycosyltransferase involved in cell wall biosynthesis